jgi:hypothetical protein
VLIHAYTIQNWTKVAMLLSLECVMDGFNVANLTTIIMQTIYINGSIFCILKLISKKLISFGANEVSVF